LENSGPYLSLVVVTHHDTNPGLFNTKFRLNFGRRQGTPNEPDPNTIVIGRSSTCAMILDYRTVSTVHAKINFQVGLLVCLSSPVAYLPTLFSRSFGSFAFHRMENSFYQIIVVPMVQWFIFVNHYH
jgi:hypothetical protein